MRLTKLLAFYTQEKGIVVMTKIGTALLFALSLGVSVIANAKEVFVTAKAEFRDPNVIPSNIKDECTDLQGNLSQSTKKFLEEFGWQVTLGDSVDAKPEGMAIKLEIVNAFSSGNAYIGHRKSVSVVATLYRDGTVVDTYNSTRDSGGGFAGGFKGSCSVLYRCTNTLGSDVAKWLNTKAAP